MERFLKQPSEAYTIAIEFSGKLPSGATLSTGTVAAVRMSDATVDNTVLTTTTATIVGTQAKIGVRVGTHGEDYKITFTVTLSNGNVLEEDVMMSVENQ